MNNAGEGVGEVNYIPVATMDIDIPEESGWSKHKRVPCRVALNGCLFGVIVDSSSNGVLECKQAGCETQWAST